MLSDFISMLFPDYCVACSEGLTKGENQICTGCRYQLPQTDFHLHKENELGKKFWGKIPLEYTLAYLKFTKTGKVQRILHALKYQGNQEIGEILGQWYGYILSEYQYHEKFDLIVPVPLHSSKLKKRGYNQSDCFVKGLSEAMQIEWSDKVLARKKATETQTRKKRFERWENVEDIFEVKDTTKVENKRILLVDDVVTTGSTMESCLKTLQDSGSSTLSIAAIAVAGA